MPPSRRASFALPSFRTTSAKLAVALVLCSTLGFVLERQMGLVKLALYPGLVLTDLQLWQLVTFIPLSYHPLGIVFGAVILWQMGGYLEASWGARRLFIVAVTVVLLAALFTLAAALFVRPLRSTVYEGGWALAGAIWVLYGLHLGRAQTNFWGVPVSGNGLAAI